MSIGINLGDDCQCDDQLYTIQRLQELENELRDLKKAFALLNLGAYEMYKLLPEDKVFILDAEKIGGLIGLLISSEHRYFRMSRDKDGLINMQPV